MEFRLENFDETNNKTIISKSRCENLFGNNCQREIKGLSQNRKYDNRLKNDIIYNMSTIVDMVK